MLSQAKKGFTIIEVVIVLVIGAIIMLMVFLVVPQLQRSQRDARRQSDARKYLAATESFASTHNGTYPVATETPGAIVPAYIAANEFNDPQTNANYNVSFSIAAADANAAGEMTYRTNATCTNNQATNVTGSAGRVAVMVFQENGARFCVNN